MKYVIGAVTIIGLILTLAFVFKMATEVGQHNKGTIKRMNVGLGE